MPRKAIEKVMLKLCEELRRGDAAAVAALYTDDAILLPPNSEMIRGRKGIEKLACALIHEVGNLNSKISQKGQKPVELKGSISSSGKHTASGWKVHSHTWNFNVP